MTYFKAVIIEKTAPGFGRAIANTKSPSKYKGMNRKDFEIATKYISCFTIEIVEI